MRPRTVTGGLCSDCTPNKQEAKACRPAGPRLARTLPDAQVCIKLVAAKVLSADALIVTVCLTTGQQQQAKA